MSSDVVGVARGVKIAVKRRVGRGVKLMEVFNLAADGMDGTEGGVAGHTVSKGFTTHSVFLISVGKGYIGPLLHIMPRAVIGRNVLEECTTEGSVGELEGMATAMVRSGGESILSQSAEEEECKSKEVEDGLSMSLIMVMGEA